MKQELKALLVRMPPDLHYKMKTQALKDKMTLQAWIIKAVEQGLKNE
jgi:predicted HicB family RNase H-like nuclease